MCTQTMLWNLLDQHFFKVLQSLPVLHEYIICDFHLTFQVRSSVPPASLVFVTLLPHSPPVLALCQYPAMDLALWHSAHVPAVYGSSILVCVC